MFESIEFGFFSLHFSIVDFELILVVCGQSQVGLSAGWFSRMCPDKSEDIPSLSFT